MSLSMDVTAEEEEAMERQFPWCCYTDFAKVLRRFRNLSEMCVEMGVDEKHVQDVVKHLNGIWGGFIFFEKTKFPRS